MALETHKQFCRDDTFWVVFLFLSESRGMFRYTCHMVIPSCSTDPTCKMLYRFKFLDMQVRVPNSSCIFKMGANKWYRYIGRSRNLLHCHKCSKSVSRAEEIISRNLKYILHNHYGYIWSEVSKFIHSHLVYDMGLIAVVTPPEPHIVALYQTIWRVGERVPCVLYTYN